jgi:cysteine desulfurase
MIYLDHAAATPLDPRVFEAMKPWLRENFANPSSIYQSGQKARAAVDDARMKVASFLNCKPAEIFFTASGTESCNWALRGVVEKRLSKDPQAHIIVTTIEHSSVLETAKYLEQYDAVEVSYVPVNAEGIIQVKDLKNAIRPDTVLVSVMLVNNEIGTIQPIQEIANICQEHGVYLHTDACQAAGYLDLNVEELGVDLLTMNAGKIYGPKGVAILFIREGTNINPWTLGGGQEFKLRAGTENVAGIVGMGKAVELLQERKNIKALRDILWVKLRKNIPGIELNGSLESRVDNNLNVFIPGVDGEMLVRRLDLLGIAISTGSACASGIVEPSHVLLALGRTPEQARSSIRITLGKENTETEMNQFVQALSSSVSALKKS